MAIGNLFGTGNESNSLYGVSLGNGGAIPDVSSFIYFEWFIFKVAASQPATPTGGTWDFLSNTGTPPTGWTNSVSGIPLDNMWFSIAFVDSRNPTNVIWSEPGLISATTSVYATAYADTFDGDGTTTVWTLTADPVTVQNLDVSINGVTQVPTVDYTISGTTFTTTTAAPITSVILVKYRQALPNSYFGTANNVGLTPYGWISATNVQAGFEEVVDDLGAADGTNGSNLIGFKQAGTGAVATTVQAKLRETVSVKDFGAVGDGVTDDTAAFVAAIASGVQEIVLPEGNYITDPIAIPNRNYLTFRGLGNPTITFTGGAYGFQLGESTHTTYARMIRLENLIITVNAATAVAFDMRSAVDCSFKNIRIQDPSNLIDLGVRIEWSWDNTFYDLVVKALNGLAFHDQANKNSIYGGRFESTDSSVGIGILSAFGSANICSGMDVSSWKQGYRIEGCAGFTIQGNYFEGNTEHDVFVQGVASGLVIEGNFFDDRTTPITCIAAGSAGASGVVVKGNAIFKHTGGTGAGIEFNATCYNWDVSANLFLNTGPNYVNAHLANNTFIDGVLESDGVNVGIGTMPQTGWGSDYKAIDLPSYSSISQYKLGAAQFNISWNAYATDATTWKYRNTGDVASRFSMDNRVFKWYSAPAGNAGDTIPFVLMLDIDTNGNLTQTVNSTAPTLVKNKTMAVQLTSDTQLTFKVRGSDGVTRAATLTLA